MTDLRKHAEAARLSPMLPGAAKAAIMDVVTAIEDIRRDLETLRDECSRGACCHHPDRRKPDGTGAAKQEARDG